MVSVVILEASLSELPCLPSGLHLLSAAQFAKPARVRPSTASNNFGSTRLRFFVRGESIHGLGCAASLRQASYLNEA
jgi:hypothetical protein